MDYESRGQRFESFRARHFSRHHAIDKAMDPNGARPGAGGLATLMICHFIAQESRKKSLALA